MEKAILCVILISVENVKHFEIKRYYGERFQLEWSKSVKRTRQICSISNQIEHQNPNEEENRNDESQGYGIDE